MRDARTGRPVSPCGAPGSAKPYRLGAPAPKPLSTPGRDLDEGAQQPVLGRVGGGDIEPARYGAGDHPAQYGTDPDRDELELALVRAAVRSGTPTLGICRGVQLLNVAFGGTLVQHLPDGNGLVEHRN